MPATPPQHALDAPDFYAVIPAGGAGTRLWPLSRSGTPKFLHDLTGAGRSLLQATVDRLAEVADSSHVRGSRGDGASIPVQR